MLTIEERSRQAKERADQLEHQRRVDIRKERESKRKIEQRRYYAIGKLVTQYFPSVLRFEPGTPAENAITFEPLEAFLAVLAADSELVQKLSRKAFLKSRETMEEAYGYPPNRSDV